MADGAPLIAIRLEGIEQLQADLEKFGPELYAAIEAAGKEAGKEILDTRGLQHYPPMTDANRLPYPYYERGFGTYYSPTRSNQSSEVLGKQFYVRSTNLTTTIGNRASYAPSVVGEAQRDNMAKIGWRKLFDVAEEKIVGITAIYQGWINRALKRSGLT